MDKLKNYLFLEDPDMFSLVEEVSSYSSILVIECEDLSFLDFVISFKDEYYPLVELLDTSIRLVLSSIKHMSLPTIWILMSRYRYGQVQNIRVMFTVGICILSWSAHITFRRWQISTRYPYI